MNRNNDQNQPRVLQARDLADVVEVTDLPNGSVLVGEDTTEDALREALAFAARIQIHTH